MKLVSLVMKSCALISSQAHSFPLQKEIIPTTNCSNISENGMAITPPLPNNFRGLLNSCKLFRYSFLFCALLYQSFLFCTLLYQLTANYISTLESISRQISETWASERPIVLWCNKQKKVRKFKHLSCDTR